MQNNQLNREKNSKNTLIILLSLFSIITVVLIILITTPVSGYEISMYGGYPWYFWTFLILSYFLSIIILVSEIFNETKNNRWILGFFIFILGNFIITLLPIFRGYCFYGGASCDIFSHYGWIKEMSHLGQTTQDNFYPIFHILTKTISDLLKVSVADVLRIIPSLFSVFYSIFMLLLAKSISNYKGQLIIIASLSLPLTFSFYHLTIHPNYFSFTFIPFVLYLYYKKMSFDSKFELTIFLLIVSFFIVFFHPITTLFLITIFLTFTLSSFFYTKFNLKSSNNEKTIKEKTGTNNLLLIVTSSFILWYASFGWGANAMRSIMNSLIYGSDFTIATQYISTLSVANLSINQTIILFLLRYGSIFIYTLLALIFFIFSFKKIFFSKKISKLEFSYTALVIMIFFLSLLMIISNFIMTNPTRVFIFFIAIATIFIGLRLHSIFGKIINKEGKKEELLFLQKKQVNSIFKKITRFKSKWILSIFTVFVLLLITILSVYSLYPSPISSEVNRHFTYMGFTGSSWIVEHRDINVQVSGDVGFNLWRIEHFVNGVTEGNARIKKETLSTPTHFGYKEKNLISQVFDNISTYLVTTESGRQGVHAFPENVQQLANQWTSKDFAMLNADRTGNKMYDNSEFEIWNIS